MKTIDATPRSGPGTARRPGGLASLGLLAASFGAVVVVAALGGALTALGLGPWYDGLPRPPWTPPAAVFGPVWTTLYVLQAIAAWLVAREGAAPGVRRAITLHGLQLTLQVAWSGAFFALRSPAAALAVMAALLVAFAVTARAFARVRPLAGGLMTPTFAWACFAAALNLAIVARA